MSTYFMKFRVVPTEYNLQRALVKGAVAVCWIVEDSELGAYNTARFYVSQDEWTIREVEARPVKVTQADFEGRDIGLTHYLQAQNNGVAIGYLGISRDGKTAAGPMPLQRPHKFDLNGYVGRQKKLSRRGRCLHFDSGTRCGEFVNAHSIQKNGQLLAIADDGHVYTLSKNIGKMKMNDGRPTLALEKQGIGKVSTFLGFCYKHDHQVFYPIDTSPLLPTGEQVALYAYRSICRELFVKENALCLIESQLAELPNASSGRSFFEALKAGTFSSLENLRKHKAIFDSLLSSRYYADIEYVLFTCRQKPFLAFSGLFFPEFDFLGRQLQDLADLTNRLDLLTFCSAPMEEGWGFLFAWHKTSSKACKAFMRSLATVVYKDEAKGADAMFRLVVSNCENLAISPIWWDGLALEQKNNVLACVSNSANIFAPTTPEYLTQGLEGVCQWHFEAVYTNS